MRIFLQVYAQNQMPDISFHPISCLYMELEDSNRIQISNTKRPLYFYVNLAKRYVDRDGSVELSGLGLAITSVVTISEILKNSGAAVVKKIETDTVFINPANPNVSGVKAKLTVSMERGEKVVTDEQLRAHAKTMEEVQ